MKYVIVYSLSVLIAAIVFMLGVFTVSAAEYSLESDSDLVGPGDVFSVRVLINSEGETLNAFEGQVLYSENVFSLEQVRDGNSLITFWVDQIQESEAGVITYSGITPGGFRGQQGELFTLHLRVKDTANASQGTISYSSLLTLLNDGLGSEAASNSESMSIEVTTESTGRESKIIRDSIDPEQFTIERTRDPLVFDNKWFIVYATQDQESGVAYYEVIETNNVIKPFFTNNFFPEKGTQWKRSTSPTVLRDQTIESFVFVKAVDREGNESIAFLPPEKIPFAVYLKEIISGILLVFFILFLTVFIWYKKRA